MHVQFTWPVAEGPIVSPLYLLVLIICVAAIFRFFSKLTEAKLSDPVKGAGEGRKSTIVSSSDLKNVLFATGILLFSSLFIITSTQLDSTQSINHLYMFSIMCWIMFIGVHIALFDVISSGLKCFGFDIRTGLKSVDFAISFFIGGRILVLLFLLLGPLGLNNSINLILAISIIWLTVRLLGFFKVEMPSNKDNFIEIENSKAPSWEFRAASLILIVGFLYLCFFNGYGSMSSWDNYTHWLLMPQEMITHDKIFSLYEVSRSVAPEYPPQQTLDFAFLLGLWGDTNSSENIVNFYNPILLFTIGWIIIELLSSRGQSILVVVAAFAFIIMAYNLPPIYLQSAYSDTRSALFMALLVVGFYLFLTKTPNSNNLAILLLICTCAFTVKTYLLPFAFAFIPFLIFMRVNLKFVTFFLVIVLACVCLEFLTYRSLAPHSMIPADSFSLSNFEKTSVQRTISAINATYGGGVLFIKLLGFGVFLLVLFFFKGLENKVRFTLTFCGCLMVGLVALLTLALSNNPAWGLSLERYLLNVIFVAFIAIFLIFTKVFDILNAKLKAQRVIDMSILGIALVCFLSTINSTKVVVSSQWVAERFSGITPYSVQRTSNLEFVEAFKEIDSTANAPIGILVHPFDSLLDHYYYNYVFARTTKNIYSFASTPGLGPIGPLLSLKKVDDIDRWLQTKRVDYVVLRQPTVILDVELPARTYDRQGFVDNLRALRSK